MLRGAIDHVSPDRVLGWVYSNVLPTTGSTVLAFLGSECVGAGKVTLLREDLLKAGLGDGKLGFSIPIGKRASNDLGRIVVRLEGSDFQLVQGQAVVVVPDQKLPPVPLLSIPGRIEWMRQQDWLEQHELDLARQLQQLGAYDLSLRKAKKPGEAAANVVVEPAAAAATVLSLLQMGEVEPEEVSLENSAGLSDTAFLASLAFPVAAVWSKRPDNLLVAEGSHGVTPAEEKSAGLANAVEYPIGPDRLLILDLRCSFGPPVASGKQACIAFVAQRAKPANADTGF